MRKTRGRAWRAVALAGWMAIVTASLQIAVSATPSSSSSGSSGPVVIHSEKNDVSPPLRSIPPKPPPSGPPVAHPLGYPRPVSNGPAPPSAAVQTRAPVVTAPALSSSFLGVGQGFSGPQGTFTVNAAPPDTNGSVGATQYVQWVNESFAVFRKSDNSVQQGPTTGNTLWTGFGGLCEADNDGDPIVVYDKAAGRWVMTQFAVTGAGKHGVPFLQCLAVSTTSDATGTFNRYSFSFGSNFPDYPKLGVWPDAYYMSFNLFSGARGSFIGADACALDRTNMLAGNPATMHCFPQSSGVDSLLPSDLDGSRPPPVGSPNFFLDIGSSTTLHLFKFHVDFFTPSNSTFTGPTSITVASFSEACGGGTCIPQLGTTQQLDSLADRLMYRLAYRNFGDHEAVVVNHAVCVSSCGVSGLEIDGVRWYELRDPNGTPSVFQQSTFAPSDGASRWMGSVAMDGAGDIGLGYSVSGSALHPEIVYTGRTPSDPAATMQSETHIINGTGSQLPTLNRWGDYSSMSIDPVDDCTFWYTNEYLTANGTFNWSTRVGNFRFSNCGTVKWTTSGTVFQAAATTLTISDTSPHKVLVLGDADVRCSNGGQCSPAANAVTISTVLQEDSATPAGPMFSEILNADPSETTVPNAWLLTSVAPGPHTFTLWVRAAWGAGSPNPFLQAGNISVRDLGA